MLTDKVLAAHAVAMARITSAQFVLAEMQAANLERDRNGLALAYSEDMMMGALQSENISEAEITALFEEARRGE